MTKPTKLNTPKDDERIELMQSLRNCFEHLENTCIECIDFYTGHPDQFTPSLTTEFLKEQINLVKDMIVKLQ